MSQTDKETVHVCNTYKRGQQTERKSKRVNVEDYLLPKIDTTSHCNK